MKRSAFVFLVVTGLVQLGSAQSVPIPQALKSYIETAMAQNPDVLATRSRWKNVDAKVDEASSSLYPRLDFSSKFTRYQGGRIVDIPNVGKFNTSGLGIVPWENTFTVSWPIGNFAIWQGMFVSKSFREASTAEVSAKELLIGYQVSEAYYNYAKANELVAVRKSAELLAKENLRVANALFSNEKAPKNDVLRAEVGVAASQGDVLSAQNMATLAKTNFNNLLHREYNAEINVPTGEELSLLLGTSTDLATKENSALTPASLSDDVDHAAVHRPELTQLRRIGDALAGIARVSWSDFLPNISLFASYGWSETKLQFSPDADLLLGGVQLKWNLFGGFGTVAKVHEAEAQLEELRYQAESAYDGIRLELINARLEKVNATERLAIAKKQIASAEENYRITKLQYDNGLATLITMIDAQTTLAAAKANLTTTTFDVLISEAKYRKALGTF